MNENELMDDDSRPPQPDRVLTRAGTMLRVVAQGLRDMDDDPTGDRRLFGFLGIVVFGRSVTFALQNLRTFEEATFDEWYKPWQNEMQHDPLLLYFNKLRTEILKDIAPPIAILLASVGSDLQPVGTITTPGRPLPSSHLGAPIEDPTAENLCRMYLKYLQKMVASAAPMVWEIQDRLDAAKHG
jgi:hypothetical protein